MTSAPPAARRVDPARVCALQWLLRIESGEPADDDDGPLPAGADGLDGRDVRFVRQLVAGVTKWRLRIDWILQPHSKRPLAEVSPVVRQALRLALYQMRWLDRVPARAAVHTSVELTKQFEHRGAGSYVNAVLRSVTRSAQEPTLPDLGRDPAAHLSIAQSHPQWLIERWLQRWGFEQTEALLKSNNLHPGVYLHRNPLRADADRLLAAMPPGAHARPLDELMMQVTSPEGLFDSDAFRDGLCYVQDPAAAHAVRLLDVEPHQRVLDLCAAPGGKSVQAALAAGDEALVVAADASARRLAKVMDSRRRLGLRSIRALAADGERLPLAAQHRFDRVLVDAPCSGTGVLRRHAEARWTKRPADLPRHASRQRRLLRAGFDALRPGGLLVYSTCSLEREENEEVVEGFLRDEPSARLDPVRNGTRFHESLPGRDEGDGSFAARLRKEDAAC